jgi:lipid A 4'-phosphatase
MKFHLKDHSFNVSKWWNLFLDHGCFFLVVFSALFFTYFANFDIWVSQLFFSESGFFTANETWWAQVIYVGTPWVGRAGLLFAIFVLIRAVLTPAKVSRRHWRRAASICAISILGIGVIVNIVLKDGVGRPRPRETLSFNGQATYVPVLVLSQSCGSNCSFVSGHAATGFALMSLGIFSIRRRRVFWLVTGALMGLSIGLVRVAQGGHFLSDIVFAFLTIWICHLVMRFTWLNFRLWQFRRLNLQTFQNATH